MKIKLGLQTITWGDPQDHIIEDILSAAKTSGFDGVEIGWRRIATIETGNLTNLLKAHQLSLSASHMGGNLDDMTQAGEERNQLDEIIEGVKAIGSPFLLYSGMQFGKEEANLKAEIDSLNRAAEYCYTQGITLLYHNHDFEFYRDQVSFNALVNDTVPQLGFAPDVGWIHKAGIDVIATLERIRDRIQTIHFKDFKTTALTQPIDTCPLGEGVVPLKEVAQWINTLDRDELWVIAEQDKYHEGPADEAAKLNGAFLQSCFGGAS